MIQDIIRRARLAQGLTLRQLSERTGIAGPNLSRLERGDIDPRLSTIDRVLDALDLVVAVQPRDRLTIDDVKRRMEKGADRLERRGIVDREAGARLDWKEARGEDTTVERRVLEHG